MMIHRKRTPAIATLLIVVIAGVSFLVGQRQSRGSQDTQLTDLAKAIAEPDAKAPAWVKYAEKLDQLGQRDKAVTAYQRSLEMDPYNRTARLECALCLASFSDSTQFYNFSRATLQIDPKLARQMLETANNFQSEVRFQELLKEAVAQSMD